MSTDKRQLTPPPPGRIRAETLEYEEGPEKRAKTDTPLLKICWDNGVFRYLVKDQPITIGSDPNCTIVVHDNDEVAETHVTLTLMPAGVKLEAHAPIYIDWQGGMKGTIAGTATPNANFCFNLDERNIDDESRYTKFEVILS